MSKSPLTASQKFKSVGAHIRRGGRVTPIFRSAELIDDPGILARPFKSPYFIFTTIMGLCCVALDAYILARYGRTFAAAAVVLLIAVVALQVVYQIVQIIRIIPTIEEFDAIATAENLAPNSPLGDAIYAAVTRFVDKLFFSYGITLGLLGVLTVVMALRQPQ